MKQSILKQFSIAHNRLQKAYLSGLISYPRVANDYILFKDLKFYEYPHKPLVEFDEFSVPLKEKEYPVTKATLPLYFTQHNISTPATLYRNFEYVDLFLDDQMRLKENMQDIEECLIEAMDIFRDESTQLYMREVIEGKIKFHEAPEEMSDTELLSVIAKDGEVCREFSQKIMSYSISIPFDQERSSEEDIKNYLNKENNGVYPLDNPTVVKSFVSPSRNYPDGITKKSVWVDTLEDVLFLENIRAGYENAINKLEKEEKKRNISLENSERSVS